MLELYQKQFPNIEQDCSVLMRYLTGQVSFGNFHSLDGAKVIATAALKAASEIKKREPMNWRHTRPFRILDFLQSRGTWH